jgi:hypothetical protein
MLLLANSSSLLSISQDTAGYLLLLAKANLLNEQAAVPMAW